MNRTRVERLLEARSVEEMLADDGEVAAIGKPRSVSGPTPPWRG